MEWTGRIVSFYRDADMVKGCMEQPGAIRYVGEVTGIFPTEPCGPGKIPDVGLIVRGRTGKSMRISAVAHYVKIHETFREADAETSHQGR